MDIQLALQKFTDHLMIPVGSTNQRPKMAFPLLAGFLPRLPTKQGLTISHPDAKLVTEAPTQKIKETYQMFTLDMHKEVMQDAEGIGSSQQQQQPTSLRPESGTPVS